MIKNTLSVVLATRNEEENLEACLESVKSIADEIVVVDEYSTDKTTEIARDYGAVVYLEPHHENFHITKQKAIDKATGDWILQLDADEVVSPELAAEIKNESRIMPALTRRGRNHELWKEKTQKIDPKKLGLFKRHQRLIEERDGKLGKKTGEIVAYFIPRRNFFLGKPLVHAGVYPDAVIRLIKKGKARLPAKSVHEQMEIDGEVGWLFNDLIHNDSPTLSRYLARLNRYTDLQAEQLASEKVPKNPLFLIHYSVFKPITVFLKLYLRHKGFLDGVRGFLWSLLSAFHFPIAYFKYWHMDCLLLRTPCLPAGRK